MKIADTFLRSRSLLSTKERQFLYWYAKLGKKKEAAIMAGYKTERASIEANKILKKPQAQILVKNTLQTLGNKLEWTYEDKLKKLKQVADIAIPEGAKKIDDLSPTAGIAAIAESNKMQGHYSAEKIVQTNVNVDVDLQQVKELMDKYKREY